MGTNDINLEDYEVTSGCLITGNDEIAVSFYDGRITANRQAIEALRGDDYVQYLAARKNQTFLIRPKPKGTKDTFRWVTGGKKRNPRKVKCVPLFYLVYRMMGWDFDCKYKAYGEVQTSEGSKVILIDLKKYEKYEPDAESGKLKTQPLYANIFDTSLGTKATAPDHDDNRIEVYRDVEVFEIALKQRKKALPKAKTEEPDGTEE